MNISLPALCCLITTRTISFLTGAPFSPLICLSGFCTLKWGKIRKMTNKYSTEKRLDRLQILLTDVCTLLLLKISPFLSFFTTIYFTGIKQDLLHYSIELVLLTCGTQFLSLSLYTTRSHAKQVLHKQLAFISLSCAILILLRHVDLWALKHTQPLELSWILINIFAFMCVLATLWLQSRTSSPRSSHYQCLSFFFGATVIASSVIASLRFPRINSIFPWRGPHDCFFGWNVVVCVTCSVFPLVFYRHLDEGVVQILLEFFFLAFYLAEWNLFQSLLLGELMFLGSSALLFLLLLGYYLLGDIRVPNKRFPHPRCFLSRDFLITCLVSPAMTKLVLVSFHLIQATPDSSHLMTFAAIRSSSFRIRCDSISIFGIYLTFFGLLCGARIMNCFWHFASLVCKFGISSSLAASSYLTAVLKVLGLAVFMYCSLDLFWSMFVQVLFGWSTSSRLLQLPITMLLTGLSILFSHWSTLSDVPHTLDTSVSLSVAHGLIFLGSFLLCAVILLGHFFNVTLSLLAGLTAIPIMTTLLISFLYGLACFQLISLNGSFLNTLFPSVFSGAFGGCAICALLLHIFQTTMDYWLLFFTIVYATCASQLWCEPQLQHGGIPVAPSRFPMDRFADNALEPNKTALVLTTRVRVRLKLIFLLLGSLSVGLALLLQFSRIDKTVYPKTSVAPFLAVAIFLLGQLSTGRLQRILMDSPQRSRHMHSSRSENCSKPHLTNQLAFESGNSKQYIEHLLLMMAVNCSVFLCISFLFYGLSLSFTDMRVLFLPWLLFGLVCPSTMKATVFPLCGFTITVLVCLFTQSHFMAAYRPPLPTFTRQWFRPSYSPWLLWSELPLTLALIPVHFVFLSHHACVSPPHLLHCALSTIGYGTSGWVDWLAHCISIVCAFVLWSTYGLTLCCLAYLLLASSAASAVFGLYSFVLCCYLLLWVDIRTNPAERFQL
ncbi:unnamed protein product [Dicrocoelium dendriticum]|nr:unnamed protein product [Dicrocoelium dendriticum]